MQNNANPKIQSQLKGTLLGQGRTKGANGEVNFSTQVPKITIKQQDDAPLSARLSMTMIDVQTKTLHYILSSYNLIL